jgi:hypothetical protein
MKLLLLLALALALTTQGHGPKLRRFTVTAYCHCRVCTHRGDGITASGIRVREGITIAAPRSIPFGTRIWVPGAGWRTVQDRLPPLRPPPRFVFHISQASPSMGHQNSNLHNPMTTRIHKPSPAERKVHSLVVQAHRRIPLLYPCPTATAPTVSTSNNPAPASPATPAQSSTNLSNSLSMKTPTPTPLTIALEVLGGFIFLALSLALYFLAA